LRVQIRECRPTEVPKSLSGLDKYKNLRGYPAAYSMHNAVLSLGVQRSEREVNCTHPSLAEAKNQWGYTSTPRVGLEGVDICNFTGMQYFLQR
jgi:hypothetical protein